MTIISAVSLIFAIALLGYLAARTHLLSEPDIKGLSRFVFIVAIPALLFHALAHLELPDQINWPFMGSYYAVALLIYGLGMLISRSVFHQSAAEQAIFGVGSAYSNMVLVGLPILSTGLGEQAILPLFMIVSIHSAIMYGLTSLLIDGRSGDGSSIHEIALQTGRSLARNPIIIGLVLGLAVNLLHITLPGPLDNTLGYLRAAALPCALFVLGASLSTFKIAGRISEALTITGLKMILQPLLVAALAFGVFHLDHLWGAVVVMAAGMPVGVNAHVLAQKYRSNIPTVSTALLLSSLLAIVTQSILLLVFTG